LSNIFGFLKGFTKR